MVIMTREVTGWSINLQWSDGTTENWVACDKFFNAQVVDDGITEYQKEKQ